jgi:hypothetical protein
VSPDDHRAFRIRSVEPLRMTTAQSTFATPSRSASTSPAERRSCPLTRIATQAASLRHFAAWFEVAG